MLITKEILVFLNVNHEINIIGFASQVIQAPPIKIPNIPDIKTANPLQFSPQLPFVQ